MASDEDRKPGRSGPPPDSAARERETREVRLPLAELLRRGLSAGRDVSESLFPRELASTLASQIIDARHGLVNAIAVEVGRFLRQADIASEMRKVLAGLNIEAKIQVRFSEDDNGQLQRKVEVERSAKKPSTPPPPDKEGE